VFSLYSAGASVFATEKLKIVEYGGIAKLTVAVAATAKHLGLYFT